jgi:hypothetical protein
MAPAAFPISAHGSGICADEWPESGCFFVGVCQVCMFGLDWLNNSAC